MPALKNRRRAQSGATLVELLVSLVIASLALALVVGTLSTGLIDSTIGKRNTAAQAVLQYEMEAITASAFDTVPKSYSDCFATESPTNPTPAPAGYKTPCPSGPYTLRADVSVQWLASAPSTVQVWTVNVTSWPTDAVIGSQISLYKIDR